MTFDEREGLFERIQSNGNFESTRVRPDGPVVIDTNGREEYLIRNVRYPRGSGFGMNHMSMWNFNIKITSDGEIRFMMVGHEWWVDK